MTHSPVRELVDKKCIPSVEMVDAEVGHPTGRPTRAACRM